MFFFPVQDDLLPPVEPFYNISSRGKQTTWLCALGALAHRRKEARQVERCHNHEAA
jgi:hypothetical protein